jgi:hypothetical protein
MADALSSVNGPVRAEPSVQLHYQFHCERPRSYVAREAVAFRRRSDHWLIKRLVMVPATCGVMSHREPRVMKPRVRDARKAA